MHQVGFPLHKDKAYTEFFSLHFLSETFLAPINTSIERVTLKIHAEVQVVRHVKCLFCSTLTAIEIGLQKCITILNYQITRKFLQQVNSRSQQ